MEIKELIKIKKEDILQKEFNLKHIFECGQCFRWNKIDESYIGVIKDFVVEAKEINGDIIFLTEIDNNYILNERKKYLKQYLRLDLKYIDIQKDLIKHISEDNLKNICIEAIKYGYGIRIIKQDFFETLISFVISQNNNIPRIKKIIEEISQKYGKKISYKNETYYTFPSPYELKNITLEELKNMGLGYRDKYIYYIVKLFTEEKNVLDFEKKLEEESLENIRKELENITGIGPKVASCIMLFSLAKYEEFPIDVWVRRVANDIYFKKENEKDLKKIEIEKWANNFGMYKGIMQQYLFYWRRENDR